ncbi:MAG: HPr family phosphocarrier protein [Lachnospiraceae bacterium]|nr:HPr family phosphocarrier protein [Lachnospiraceae bacterium]
MKKVMVSLNSIDKVKTFVKDVSQFDCDFDLISGRYVIDAKSMLGIFSLDLSRPIELTIHADDAKADEIIEALKIYLA